MALENGAELADVLTARENLGKVFARHAYGMRAWVDIFSERVPGFADPEVKTLVAALVADNARHMMMFRERALSHGVDPDAYSCPAEGEAIYERIDDLHTVEELYGYALGSLDHFDELLSVYRGAADGEDAATVDAVRADVERMRAALRPLVGPSAQALLAEAHELYRIRELVETPRYLHAA
jgi:hypothetical protein